MNSGPFWGLAPFWGRLRFRGWCVAALAVVQFEGGQSADSGVLAVVLSGQAGLGRALVGMYHGEAGGSSLVSVMKPMRGDPAPCVLQRSHRVNRRREWHHLNSLVQFSFLVDTSKRSIVSNW